MDSEDKVRRIAVDARRQRTRQLLINAAQTRFAEAGWHGTRLEDVAADVGIGNATAFRHFNKRTLMAYAYVPFVTMLAERAAADIAGGQPPTESLTRHVQDMATTFVQHRNLTIALISAVYSPVSSSTEDLRDVVPLPAPMTELILYGQASGEFAASVEAYDVAVYHTNAALLQVFRSMDDAEKVAESTLSWLLSLLRPNG